MTSVELVRVPGGRVWHRVDRWEGDGPQEHYHSPMLLCRTVVLNDLMTRARATGTYVTEGVTWWMLDYPTAHGRQCQACERIARGCGL